jgi:hypothetical protein
MSLERIYYRSQLSAAVDHLSVGMSYHFGLMLTLMTLKLFLMMKMTLALRKLLIDAEREARNSMLSRTNDSTNKMSFYNSMCIVAA